MTCRLIGNFYAYYGNTAVDLDTLPVSHARWTVVEPALFERDVFWMVTPIQSPAKCEVRSVIQFLNAKRERPAEILKEIFAVYGNVMNWQNVTKWCRNSPREVRLRCWIARRSHDVVRRTGGRILWLGDTEAGSKT